MKFYLNTDGGARGNPGPGAIGIVIRDENDEIIYELGMTIGICTNNEAEYKALIEGLKMCREKNIDNVECRMDSELVQKQLIGKYKVKDERMLAYWTIVKKLESEFKKIDYIHILRTKNKEADKLVNQALDSSTNI